VDVARGGGIETAAAVGVAGPPVVRGEVLPLQRPVLGMLIGGTGQELERPVGAGGLARRGQAELPALVLDLPVLRDLHTHTVDVDGGGPFLTGGTDRRHHPALARLELDVLQGLAAPSTGAEREHRGRGPRPQTDASAHPAVGRPTRRARHVVPLTPRVPGAEQTLASLGQTPRTERAARKADMSASAGSEAVRAGRVATERGRKGAGYRRSGCVRPRPRLDNGD